MTGTQLALLGASYLMGAFPTSYVTGKLFRGIDLREHGSRNLGATNVYRVLGWKFAIPVALVDIAKGTVPTVVLGPLGSPEQWFQLLCGLMAVVGHVLSVFVNFKGGKGVATAAGVVLGLAPKALGAALGVWIALVWLTGYVSVGSLAAAVVFAAAHWFWYPGHRDTMWLDAILVALIWYMHRANIRRLLAGTENRFGRRAGPAAGSAA